MASFEDENPFAVRKAVVGSEARTANLNDYGPFDASRNAALPASPGGAETVPGPSIMAPVPPPVYTPTAQHQISTADFRRRQEDLERRARDLERREAELRSAPSNVRQNNWPPMPSFCPFQPCFYQDINVDIPTEFQRIVKNLYYLWVAHIGLLCANMIAGLLYLFAGGDKGQTFGLALVYWAIFTPLSFVCWYRPAYKAFRDDSSFNFMVFFFVFFVQFLMSIIFALGIGGTGSCGVILAISQLANDGGWQIFTGVCMLLTAIGFGLCALGDFHTLATIHRLYRRTGASLAKAQAEFTSGVMSNEHVQAAAAAAVRNQSNPAGSTGPNERAP